MHAFHTFTLESTIESYSKQNFTFFWLSSFSSVINSGQIVNYVLDVDGSKIVIFDDSWENVGFKTFTRPVTMISFGDIRYIAGLYDIYKADAMLNVIHVYVPSRQYSPGGMISYRGLYFNIITNSLFAIADTQKLVFNFDSNLNQLDTIDISPNVPRSINGNNNLVYVGTRDGLILVIDNQTIVQTFNGCTGASDIITSIVFDSYGYLATVCESLKSAYIYSNGSYIGESLNFDYLLEFVNFDANGKLIFLSAYGVHILA